jgi:hypothetical protein
MSLATIRDRVLLVLKLYDKIDVSKVKQIFYTNPIQF